MAPEQTGRMNRSMDFRSDLYALGVTFYEMLTGRLPFTAADPMGWVHCHIARQPVPPNERVAGLPRLLSAIMMKLLAKTAEERYQTAAGVEADFRRCLADLELNGHIDPFPLGVHDASDWLLIPEKLYGREREIDALVTAFDRVAAHGGTELLVVSGYSGIGKSSVVDRVQLQQVIINLVMNGIEAMQSVTDRPRELLIRSRQHEKQPVLVSVTDCGVGISAENADRLFNAFFTTKSSGMGMGLSICRSIMEAHGGRLWATANIPHVPRFSSQYR